MDRDRSLAIPKSHLYYKTNYLKRKDVFPYLYIFNRIFQKFQMFPDVFFISHLCRVIKFLVFHAIRQILLCHIMIGVVMSIQLSCTSSQTG